MSPRKHPGIARRERREANLAQNPKKTFAQPSHDNKFIYWIDKDDILCRVRIGVGGRTVETSEAV